MVPNSPSAPHTDPPSVSAVNGVVLAAEGEEAVLACEATGVPLPRVIWYRGTWIGWGEGPAEGACRRGLRGALEDQLFRTVMGGTRNGVSGEKDCFKQPPSPLAQYPYITDADWLCDQEQGLK